MSFGKHVKGENCKTCCCSGPSKCAEPNCTGWVHQDVVDEDTDPEYGGWIHNYKCDTCGKEQYAEPDLEVEFV